MELNKSSFLKNSYTSFSFNGSSTVDASDVFMMFPIGWAGSILLAPNKVSLLQIQFHH